MKKIRQLARLRRGVGRAVEFVRSRLKGLSLPKAAQQEEVQEIPLQLVPGYCFFCNRTTLPDGIRPQEIPGFIEFSLEGLSPLPLEHLAFGSVQEAEGQGVLIYAAARDRLSATVEGDLERAFYVLPSFVSLLGLPTPGWQALLYKDCLTLLRWTSDHALPIEVHSTDLPEGTLAAAFAGMASLGARAHAPNLTGLPLHVLKGGDILPDETVVFELERYESADAAPEVLKLPCPLRPDELWLADLRDSALRQREIRVRRASKRLWTAAKAAAVTTVVLVLLQLTVGSLALLRNAAKRKFARQAPPVSRIEKEEYLLTKIRQFSEQELQAFLMLEILNNYRPREVTFLSVSTGKYNELAIQGTATNADQVNAYTRALEASGALQSVDVPEILSRSRGVNFNLNVRFKPLPKTGALTAYGGGDAAASQGGAKR